jgi:pSer/pThr/pTyr-binding forkhead associated (FHA) protein
MTLSDSSFFSIEHGQSRRLVPLRSGGTIIGRSDSCDVVLDDLQVSRAHARVFQDPFDRWIVEDLHSHNGLLVEGRRGDRTAIAPGQSFGIGPFRLRIAVERSDRPQVDATIFPMTSVLEGQPGLGVTRVATDAPQTLSGLWMKQLNLLGERLSSVVGPQELCAEACRCLACELGMIRP